MSTEVIFIAEAFGFAGAVCGAVMVDGFALRVMMVEQDRDTEPPAEPDD